MMDERIVSGEHVLCGAGEPDDADGDAALYPPHEPFSNKLENHAHMVALYALWYNFVRVHKTLRTSPAQAADSRLGRWETWLR
jgi:hypothetical protein